MANPVITSTTTRWADATHISAAMSFNVGTGTIIVYEGATQKASVTTTSGATKSITFTGISKSKTYRINYRVVSGSYTASKWDELIGATPVISTHPNGGVTLGAKAASGEFRVKYPSFFDAKAKFNAGLMAYGIEGTIVGDGSDTPPNAPAGILFPIPYITNYTLNLPADSSTSGLRTFLTAWIKYLTANFPSSNAYALWLGMCSPGMRCIVLWYPYNTSDVVSGMPRYSMGFLVPFGSDSVVYKFGSNAGTFFMAQI